MSTSSTLLSLQAQINRLKQCSIKEILYTNTDVSGLDAGCQVFAIDKETGSLYYKDSTGVWVLVPTGGGGGGGTGTVNPGVANRLAYYPSNGTTVDDLAAITANRALISNASGLPIASSVTNTELGFVSGVTSAIQTQIDGKEPAIAGGFSTQYWRGDKTWQTLPIIPTFSYANIGSSPNAQGATYSSGTMTLQPASASFGGVITTSTQTLGAGDKTFTNKVAIGATAGGVLRGDLSIANFILTRDTSPVSGSLRFGDGTGWRFHIGQMLVSGVQQTGDGAAYMTFRDTGGGSIGINNINPTEKLDVVGNIRFSGALLPNNISGTSGQVLTSAGPGNVPTWTTITTTPPATINFVDSESPAGTKNSTNVTFTLANTPTAGSLHLYFRGLRLKLTDDYTLSGTTITMVTAPDLGDALLADYRY